MAIVPSLIHFDWTSMGVTGQRASFSVVSVKIILSENMLLICFKMTAYLRGKKKSTSQPHT